MKNKPNIFNWIWKRLCINLKPGQTYEISDVYIGQYQKLPTRVIFHRLTEEQTRKGWGNQALKEKKKGIVMKERSKRLSAMNVYITNALPEDVATEHVHDLYSLRWQIELIRQLGRPYRSV